MNVFLRRKNTFLQVKTLFIKLRFFNTYAVIFKNAITSLVIFVSRIRLKHYNINKKNIMDLTLIRII